MSDTPRTDAHEQNVKGPNPWSPYDCGAVHAHFARTLERENNDLRKLLEADTAFLRSKGFTTLTELLEDKKRLDWLTNQGTPGLRWIARGSTQGRGYRLHQDLVWAVHEVNYETPRAAIDAARKATP